MTGRPASLPGMGALQRPRPLAAVHAGRRRPAHERWRPFRDAAELLRRAEAAGLSVRADGGRLVLTGRQPSPDLLHALAGAKAELLEHLVLAGLRRAALMRPPAWTGGQEARPWPGCWCGGCGGTVFRRTTEGWCCASCRNPG